MRLNCESHDMILNSNEVNTMLKHYTCSNRFRSAAVAMKYLAAVEIVDDTIRCQMMFSAVIQELNQIELDLMHLISLNSVNVIKFL
jgi:hypothetical protein